MENRKNILLLGGGGFIGRNLTEYLKDKFTVSSPKREELDLLNGEETKEFLSARNFDVVIHAAGAGVSRGQKASGVFEANKQMFLNVAANAEKFGKMIFFGSGAEYGKHRPIVKIKESEFGAVLPEDEYGRAKYFASEYIASTRNIINLRFFGVFGKYEDYITRFISNAICHAVLNLPIVINQNVVFDYLYINDLAKIAEHFINSEAKDKFYNSGTGQPVDLLTIAQIVKKVSGKNLEIKLKNAGLNKEYSCDNSRLLREMPELAFTPLEQSVKELYKWYSENTDRLDKAILTAQI